MVHNSKRQLPKLPSQLQQSIAHMRIVKTTLSKYRLQKNNPNDIKLAIYHCQIMTTIISKKESDDLFFLMIVRKSVFLTIYFNFFTSYVSI